MKRCLQLAALGAGRVAPNPMVGAVLVHEDRIIGEGYHRQFGHAHAEVNCLNSVSAADQHLLKESVLYVSLEPCAHFGKTPPCTDLIIGQKIGSVVIGCKDSFAAVNGKGIEKLKAAGIQVRSGVLEKECIELNKRFFTFHEKQRPWIILKWAQSSNNMIGAVAGERVFISNVVTNRAVHKWRAREAAILVGTNTAMIDNPMLTTRYWPGNNPVRVVIDKNLKLPQSLNLFDGQSQTIVFNTQKQAEEKNVFYYKLKNDADVLGQLMAGLHQLNLQSLIVEGGANILQQFIDAGLWDEARVITNPAMTITEGVPSPVLKNGVKVKEVSSAGDTIVFFANAHT